MSDSSSSRSRMVPPPPAMSKLRTQPMRSLGKPPSIWLRENFGCHSGRLLKSRTWAQTFSTGASITALTNTFVMVSSLVRQQFANGGKTHDEYVVADIVGSHLRWPGRNVEHGPPLRKRLATHSDRREPHPRHVIGHGHRRHQDVVRQAARVIGKGQEFLSQQAAIAFARESAHAADPVGRQAAFDFAGRDGWMPFRQSVEVAH